MNEDPLSDALARCLADIESGVPVETAIARQGDQAAALRPLVQLALAVRRRRPRPAPTWRARAQADLVARQPRRRWWWRWPVTVATPGLAMAAMMLAVLGVGVVAAASGPGDPLYPVRTAVLSWMRSVTGAADADRTVLVADGRPVADGLAISQESPAPGLGGSPAPAGRLAGVEPPLAKGPAIVLRRRPPLALALRAQPVMPPLALQPVPVPAAALPPVSVLAPDTRRSTAAPVILPLPSATAVLPSVTPEAPATATPGAPPESPSPTMPSEPAGVISGQVLAADGRPLSKVLVSFSFAFNGRWYEDRRGDITNDEGRFTVGQLSPGRYRVFAFGGPFRLPPRWYPDVDDPDRATVIELHEGEERQGVDIRYAPPPRATPTPTVEVTPSATAGMPSPTETPSMTPEPTSRPDPGSA